MAKYKVGVGAGPCKALLISVDAHESTGERTSQYGAACPQYSPPMPIGCLIDQAQKDTNRSDEAAGTELATCDAVKGLPIVLHL